MPSREMEQGAKRRRRRRGGWRSNVGLDEAVRRREEWRKRGLGFRLRMDAATCCI
jgi:hypothetical protein